ncbi:cache domain-containing protein [Poseidonocella sp. HB161398]|uniref:cache domain-containing protein n=1 Tax=Poseidonocella sp. HB161398 TaxID=2320855 RepID=UPI001486F078|nr:cache domain-containing protein [Poseidonocella sp. HB161398]
MQRTRPERIPRATFSAAMAVLLATLAAAVFVAGSVSVAVRNSQEESQRAIMLRGSEAVALSFNTALKREWDSLHAVAANIGSSSPDEIADFMDAVSATGGQVAWAGVASTEGTIISGSNRLREGQDVSQRRWFREGLRRPNVGGVFRSASLPGGTDGEPEALLNLSTPVKNADGETIGVLVYGLRMAWVNGFLRQAREQLGIDIVVLDDAGDTLVDTRDDPQSLPEDVIASARLGQMTAGRFSMLDGGTGAYAYNPDFIQQGLPDFRWNAFAVLDKSRLTNVLPDLIRNLGVVVTVAALFVLAAVTISMRLLLGPIESLADTAREVAKGNFAFPVETASSREAATLSIALAKIQVELAGLRVNRPTSRGKGALKLLFDRDRDATAPGTAAEPDAPAPARQG